MFAVSTTNTIMEIPSCFKLLCYFFPFFCSFWYLKPKIIWFIVFLQISLTEELSAASPPIPTKKKKQSSRSNTDELVDLASSYFKRPENESDILAKGWAMKLSRLTHDQRRYAEKIINDTLFEAEMGTLTRNGVVFLSSSSSSLSISSTPPISPYPASETYSDPASHSSNSSSTSYPSRYTTHTSSNNEVNLRQPVNEFHIPNNSPSSIKTTSVYSSTYTTPVVHTPSNGEVNLRQPVYEIYIPDNPPSSTNTTSGFEEDICEARTAAELLTNYTSF